MATSHHKLSSPSRNEVLCSLACARWILSWVDDKLYRARKRCRGAFNCSTIPVEDPVLLLKLFDCPKWVARIIPYISIPRDHAQGQLLTYPTNDKEGIRLLHKLRFAIGIPESLLPSL